MPISVSDGRDADRVCDEPVPSIATSLDDVVVAFPDAPAEFVAAEILPDVLDRIEFGRIGRQVKQGDVFGYGQSLSGLVPTGAIADQHGMGAGANLLADLGKVDGHRLAVDPGRDNGSACSTRRTDRAEEVGRVMTIVANCRRAAATRRPLVRQRALLTDAGLVLEPDFDRLASCSGRQDRSYEGREVF